jgi:very-short-patch-repair endonuclease
MKYLHNDPALKNRRRELRKNQTDAEKRLWASIRNRQFYKLRFLRQYSIGPYILDFYCPALNLAIELDGGQHNEDKGEIYDAERSRFLKDRGIDVLRFWNHEVLQNIRGVLAKLEEMCNPSQPPLKIRGGERGPS